MAPCGKLPSQPQRAVSQRKRWTGRNHLRMRSTSRRRTRRKVVPPQAGQHGRAGSGGAAVGVGGVGMVDGAGQIPGETSRRAVGARRIGNKNRGRSAPPGLRMVGCAARRGKPGAPGPALSDAGGIAGSGEVLTSTDLSPPSRRYTQPRPAASAAPAPARRKRVAQQGLMHSPWGSGGSSSQENPGSVNLSLPHPPARRCDVTHGFS